MNNEFKSRQVYPNLKSSIYIIEFFLPEDAIVTLSILSEQGKTLEQIIRKVKFDSGRHEIEIESNKYNGNFCYYRLSMQTDQQEIVDTKKIFMNNKGGSIGDVSR